MSPFDDIWLDLKRRNPRLELSVPLKIKPLKLKRLMEQVYEKGRRQGRIDATPGNNIKDAKLNMKNLFKDFL